MKANLAEREPEILKFWKENRIYEKLQDKNRASGVRCFILHDGPPYANGHIHIGHALNKILKDIIVKYHSMLGQYCPFVPGWDCHGLPIELQVDKSLGKAKENIDIFKKRQLCREYAEKFINIQRDEFIRLGVFGYWETPYITMSNDYEATIVREFLTFVKNGYVYRGKKPVYWCPSCITALADAEVEYAEKESPSVFVIFEVIDKEKLPVKDLPIYIVIWTTTPWTLPANFALAVHPDFDYVGVKSSKGVLIIVKEAIRNLKDKIEIDETPLFEIKGKELEGIKAKHPFIDRVSKVVVADFVETAEGTGVVHIAPGHGEEDYEVGLKYGLEIYAPVDDRGRFTEDVPYFAGENVFKANKAIIEHMKETGSLLWHGSIKHSYPHCWRCKKPIIFRATTQWFISMSHGELRKRALAEVDKVRWIPSWGRDRIFSMIERRPDWCLSRQRTWGVPITLFVCKKCGYIVNDENLFNKICSLVEAEGSDVWFKLNLEDLIPGYSCPECGSKDFQKEKDILDVWFDSGVSHAAVLERDPRLSWPADMYLEGSDQHRGWFQSSLIASLGNKGRAPYKIVLTHGFTVDGQGRKMSKSLGNVIAPQEIIKSNGADIVRLWVSAEDYRDDIKLSQEILSRLTEAYRKIRNTLRYLLGNIYDYDGKDYSDCLLEIDRWAMMRLQKLITKVKAAYENFEFHQVFHAVYNFCVTDMSAFYLDILKDRLYTFKSDSQERRAAQWVLYNIADSLIKLIAPILSFTAEEAWQHLPYRKTESVFLEKMPDVQENFIDEELQFKWEKLIEIRDEVNRALEIKRQEKLIGNSLEAKVVLSVNEKLKSFLEPYYEFLPALFIVSQVQLVESQDTEFTVTIEKAEGAKCQRCWNYSAMVGKLEIPDVCPRCYHVLKIS
ncbi:isoleucine--tRNA ligase [Thermodesulfovibrio sp. 3907-1M]|uniref:Isoleucine--tRNA ligase n=1 Tax=Thermodesulfovibrio autotrophicus TaxID=3118333 RepID=A0AAU8H1E0_9BACT